MSRVRESKLKGKSYVIPKRLLWDAWLKVKENGGAAGVDGVTIEQFGEDLSGNLYRLWNRMSSGSYFPGPVRAVEIPKKGKQGGIRPTSVSNVVLGRFGRGVTAGGGCWATDGAVVIAPGSGGPSEQG
jgi:RNA-directed DNA polymerase